jgi:protein-S-isoprenylcysteine O-methyltransferase Ste14
MGEVRGHISDILPSIMVSLLIFLQIIIGLYLIDGEEWIIVSYLGGALYIVSGFIFGVLPILELRRSGVVRQGKSYIHTTKIVDQGIYSIIRHPQFFTWILWALAGMLVFQQWLIVLLGIPVFPLTYLDLVRADKKLLDKFGDEYKIYMEKVPRTNFMVGLVKVFRNKMIQ